MAKTNTTKSATKKTTKSKPRSKWRGKDGQMLAYYLVLNEGEMAALKKIENACGYSKAAILRALILEASDWAKDASETALGTWATYVADFERSYGPRARVPA